MGWLEEMFVVGFGGEAGAYYLIVKNFLGGLLLAIGGLGLTVMLWKHKGEGKFTLWAVTSLIAAVVLAVVALAGLAVLLGIVEAG